MTNIPAQTNGDTRYTISDVSNKLQVSTNLLRKWEKYGYIVIKKDNRGHRYYTNKDINTLKSIKKMVSTKAYAENRAKHAKVDMPTLYNISEAADKLQVTTNLLRKWETYGHIKPSRNEKVFRFYTQNDIDKLLELKTLISSKEHAVKKYNENKVNKSHTKNYIENTKKAATVINKLQYGAMASGILMATLLFLATLFTTDTRFKKTTIENGSLLGTAIEKTIDEKSSQVAQVLG